MEYKNQNSIGPNHLLRILVAFSVILIPSILLLKGIYGSFLFTFSIPLLWQVVYLGKLPSSLGLKKQSLASSIVVGVVSGIVLGLLGGKIFQLLDLTGHSFINTDSIHLGLGAFRLDFLLGKELGYQLLVKSNAPLGLVLYFLFNILLIGLGEEIFWRGFIQRKIGERVTKSVAIIITAVLFALIHSYLFIILPLGKGVVLLIFVGIVGAIWGYLYERTGNIWSVAISHGILAAIIWKYYFFTSLAQ